MHWGGRKRTHAPRQQIKCSLAGRTWGLALSCPPSPQCPVSSRKLLSPLQRRAAGLSRRGPLGPQDPECGGRIFPWPVQPDHPASCVHTWASPTRGLGRVAYPGLMSSWPGPGGGQGRQCAERTAQGRGADAKEGGGAAWGADQETKPFNRPCSDGGTE